MLASADDSYDGREVMPTANLTSNGRMTFPIEVRRKLGMQPGDRVEFVLNRPGEVVLRPKKVPLTALLGILAAEKQNRAFRK